MPESGQEPRASVVIVAAGVSRRMVDVDKVFAPLLEKPLIAHTVAPFEDCPQVGEIVLVLHRDNLERGRRLVEVEGWRKVARCVPGGERRQDSVKAGLDSLSPCRWVMVHDGARPCITQDTLRRCIQEAEHTGAAIPTVAVNDTVKRVDADGIVVSTVRGRSCGRSRRPRSSDTTFSGRRIRATWTRLQTTPLWWRSWGMR